MKIKKWKIIATNLLLVIPLFSIAQVDKSNTNDLPSLPTLHWKFSIKAPIYSSPVTDSSSIFFGGLDSFFYAVDIISGNEIWKYKTKGEIRSTAFLSGNRIYFVSSDGKIYCLDKTGKLIWNFTAAEKKYDFADYHQSSPVLYKGVLYAGMGDGNLYAVDEKSGKLNWKFQTGGPVHNLPVLDSNNIYFGSFDGNIYAVNIKTRKLVWKFKTVGHLYFPKGEVQGSPYIMNNTIIIGARDYNVYAIDREKGFAHWNKAFTRGWVLSNIYKDSILYLAGADERILTSINGKTLKENWKRTMELLMFGKPAFTKNMLYIGTTIGKLHGIDIKTGEDKWVFTTEGYKQNHGKYFKQDDSYREDIYSIITSNEQFLEAQVSLGGIFSTPLLYGSYILFTSTEGTLYCLKGNQISH